MRLLGWIRCPHDSILIVITAEEKDRARSRLESLGLAETAPIAFNTGSGSRWETKRWPMESFLELADLLGKYQPGRVLLLGGPEEHETNTRMAGERPDRCYMPTMVSHAPSRVHGGCRRMLPACDG